MLWRLTVRKQQYKNRNEIERGWFNTNDVIQWLCCTCPTWLWCLWSCHYKDWCFSLMHDFIGHRIMTFNICKNIVCDDDNVQASASPTSLPRTCGPSWSWRGACWRCWRWWSPASASPGPRSASRLSTPSSSSSASSCAPDTGAGRLLSWKVMAAISYSPFSIFIEHCLTCLFDRFRKKTRGSDQHIYRDGSHESFRENDCG